MTQPIEPGRYYMARIKVDHPERKHQDLYVIAVQPASEPETWLVASVFNPKEKHVVHARVLTPESEKLRLSRLASQERDQGPRPPVTPDEPTSRVPVIPRLDTFTPIERLIQHVRDALADYDRSGDHREHAPAEDCLRCRLREALPEKWRD